MKEENKKIEEMELEELFKNIEEISTELSNDNLNLDEAIKKYTLGMQYSKEAFEQLNKAEKQVQKFIDEKEEEQ